MGEAARVLETQMEMYAGERWNLQTGSSRTDEAQVRVVEKTAGVSYTRFVRHGRGEVSAWLGGVGVTLLQLPEKGEGNIIWL